MCVFFPLRDAISVGFEPLQDLFLVVYTSTVQDQETLGSYYIVLFMFCLLHNLLVASTYSLISGIKSTISCSVLHSYISTLSRPHCTAAHQFSARDIAKTFTSSSPFSRIGRTNLVAADLMHWPLWKVEARLRQ